MSEVEQSEDAQAAPQAQIPIEQIIAAFEAHLNVVMMGLCVCHPGIQGSLMWELLGRAAGRVFSRSTKANAVADTLALRDKFAKIFTDELRKFVPALDKAYNVPPPANGNAMRQ